MEEKNENIKKTDKGISIGKILMGEYLVDGIFRKNAPLFVLILFYIVLYIDNRYLAQNELIEIDRLKKTLVDTKYDALTVSSDLTEMTRQSKLEEYIQQNHDDLKVSSTPPLLIKKETDKK